MQFVVPPGAQVPARHPAHAVAPAEKDTEPGAQGTHVAGPVAFGTADEVPALQAVQLAMPPVA